MEGYYKLPRHLERLHSEEIEVAKALSCPKKSKKRRELLVAIRNMGDYKFNVESLQSRTEGVVVRESKNKKNCEYTPCVNCKGFFHPRNLFRHMKTCKSGLQTVVGDGDVSVRASRTMLASSVSNDDVSQVNAILLRMRRDELHFVIRNDSVLLKWAAMNLEKTGISKTNDLSYTLRTMARVLLQFRKITSNDSASIKDLIQPVAWDSLISSMKAVCEYKDCPEEIGIPSLVIKIGHSLKSIAEYLRLRYLTEENAVAVSKTRDFLEIFNTGWELYNNNAFKKLDSKKDNMPEELPLDSDIRKFRSFVLSNIRSICLLTEKSSSISCADWRNLERYVLARVISFNAKRGSEPSRLTLDMWDGVMQDRWKRQEDIQGIQDPVERKLVESLKVCYLQGKRKRGKTSRSIIPVLFTEDMVKGINILIKHRSECGISNVNKFIFATTSFGSRKGLSTLKGWDTLQEVAMQISGLDKPKLITPTRNRKLLATCMQLLDMTDAQLSWITDHMGHTKDIHKQWYRQEESTIELTKVANVLLAIDRNENLTNKKIDELNQGEYFSVSKNIQFLSAVYNFVACFLHIYLVIHLKNINKINLCTFNKTFAVFVKIILCE